MNMLAANDDFIVFDQGLFYYRLLCIDVNDLIRRRSSESIDKIIESYCFIFR